MRKKIIACYLIFILPAFFIKASACDSIPIPYSYLQLGLGFSKVSVLDQINTCLPYSGPGFGVSVGYERCKKNVIDVGNDFLMGALLPYDLPEYNNQVSFYYNNFHAKYLWRLPIKKAFCLQSFAGPEIKMQFGSRINNAALANSVLAYDMNLCMGVSVMLARDFSLHRIFKKASTRKCISVRAKVSYPIVAKVYTPPYIGMPESLLQEETFFLDMSSAYRSILTRFVNPELRFILSYNMRNGNALAFQYNFNYQATYPEINPTKACYNYFGFSLQFNLKKSGI